MVMVNNWDLKTSQNAIYRVQPDGDDPRNLYVVKDLGASFGKTNWLLPGTRNDSRGLRAGRVHQAGRRQSRHVPLPGRVAGAARRRQRRAGGRPVDQRSAREAVGGTVERGFPRRRLRRGRFGPLHQAASRKNRRGPASRLKGLLFSETLALHVSSHHERRPCAGADRDPAVLRHGTASRVSAVSAVRAVPDAARLGGHSRRVLLFPVPAA